jgi:hypothetical protein
MILETDGRMVAMNVCGMVYLWCHQKYGVFMVPSKVS